jgi:hypothetical protein
LLTNDELPMPASVPMKLVTRTEVLYTDQPPRGDTVFTYQRY